jgi:hypothetical protein
MTRENNWTNQMENGNDGAKFMWESEMCWLVTPFILMEMIDRFAWKRIVCLPVAVSYCPCGRELFIVTTPNERRK